VIEMSLNFETLNSGKIVFMADDININDLKWNETAFEGVYLKHLVKANSTDNTLSCHLVKIKAGCQIGEHFHEGKLELHEVLEGQGKAFLNGKEIEYESGVFVVIPADIKHSVIAGNEDLYLLAKFAPALL
jgi:quercetin dioxygenase-like cupin family protein